jgi:hypothetical protein
MAKWRPTGIFCGSARQAIVYPADVARDPPGKPLAH